MNISDWPNRFFWLRCTWRCTVQYIVVLPQPNRMLSLSKQAVWSSLTILYPDSCCGRSLATRLFLETNWTTWGHRLVASRREHRSAQSGTSCSKRKKKRKRKEKVRNPPHSLALFDSARNLIPKLLSRLVPREWMGLWTRQSKYWSESKLKKSGQEVAKDEDQQRTLSFHTQARIGLKSVSSS